MNMIARESTPAKEKAMPSAHTESKSSPFQGMQLLMVQSAVCAAVLLLTLVLRLIGGDFFQALGQQFTAALADNTISAAVMSWFESNPLEAAVQSVTTSTTGATEATTTTTTTNAASVAAGGHLNDPPAAAAYAPLTGGELTSSFGSRSDPFTGETAYHGGMDIAAASGTPLAAMFSGTVKEIGYEADGYGNYVLIEYGTGLCFLYAHCQSITVAQGERVSAGQMVAEMGSTGRSTGPHVHVEWRINGQRYNPAAVVPPQVYA